MSTLPTAFRPIPCHRHDGWTPARQWDFIQALADCGSVAQAAARVGLSSTAAYRLRRHPAADDFRSAWDAALIDAMRRVQESAVERALHGETEVYERDGMRVTRHKPCSPQLMIAVLARAERLLDATARVAEAQADLARTAAADRWWAAENHRLVPRRDARGRIIPPAPAEPWVVPPAPLSPETPVWQAVYALAQEFPDRPGWEGPDTIPDDGAVPALPMPAATIAPASHRHTAQSGAPKLVDAETRAARDRARAMKAEARANANLRWQDYR